MNLVIQLREDLLCKQEFWLVFTSIQKMSWSQGTDYWIWPWALGDKAVVWIQWLRSILHRKLLHAQQNVLDRLTDSGYFQVPHWHLLWRQGTATKLDRQWFNLQTVKCHVSFLKHHPIIECASRMYRNELEDLERTIKHHTPQHIVPPISAVLLLPVRLSKYKCCHEKSLS